MHVVSVDPAPKKKATIFDGSIHHDPQENIVAFCAGLVDPESDLFRQSVLLCWDAPLTGPADADSLAGAPFRFSQRIIEQFFSRESNGFKCPPGISVLPYSGCPHWAVSRAAIGLPRVSRFDEQGVNLPFQIVHDPKDICDPGRWVVETHPAVAIWLWCRHACSSKSYKWIYKGARKDKEAIANLWPILTEQWLATGVSEIALVIGNLETPNSDDELDAIVGWVLGVLLVNRHPSVDILGDAKTGSFAVPVDENLIKQFADFERISSTVA